MLKIKFIVIPLLMAALIISGWSYHRLHRHTLELQAEIKSLQERQNFLNAKNDALRTKLKKMASIMQCTEIQSQTEHIRGLRAKKPLLFKTMPKSDLRNLMHEKFEEEYPPEEFESLETALKKIGFLDADINLKKILFDLWEEQIAAFYDMDSETLYSVKTGFMSKNIANMFLSHEIVHALQDQHFDLEKLGLADKQTTDTMMALRAIVEGDATYCMSKFYTQNLNYRVLFDTVWGAYASFKQEKIDNAPVYVKESLLFPYMQGLAFMSYLYNYHEAQNTASENNMHPPTPDDVFKNPPTTTEQIMHFDKYFPVRDEPTYPSLPDLPPLTNELNSHVIYTDVLGEWGYKTLLKSHVRIEMAASAAEGWDGDIVFVLQDNDNDQLHDVVMISNWDSVQDTQEFINVYLCWAASQFSEPDSTIDIAELTSPDTTVLLSDPKQLRFSIKDNQCIIIISDTNHSEKILDFITEN